MRVCSSPGCPELVSKAGRCTSCERLADKARGSRQARGYDAAHDRLRVAWAPRVATGQVECWRCEELLDPLKPWHLGHDDQDRTIYRGPECVPCNTATSGR